MLTLCQQLQSPERDTLTVLFTLWKKGGECELNMKEWRKIRGGGGGHWPIAPPILASHESHQAPAKTGSPACMYQGCIQHLIQRSCPPLCACAASRLSYPPPLLPSFQFTFLAHPFQRSAGPAFVASCVRPALFDCWWIILRDHSSHSVLWLCVFVSLLLCSCTHTIIPYFHSC